MVVMKKKKNVEMHVLISWILENIISRYIKTKII